MTRVALFGGSFNPPHLAHELVSLLVLETCDVDALWWVPTYRHAFGKDLAPWTDRLAMCHLAVERLGPAVAIEAIEATLPGPESRTLHSIEALEARHPGHRFRWVIGADILAETDQWYRWDEVARRAPPIVISRSGFDSAPYEDAALPEVPRISSTEIRERVAAGQSAVPLVSRAVMDYIAGRGLYR